MRPCLYATIALLAVAPAAHAQRHEDLQRIDTTFAFAKGGTVNLGQVSGDITVTGWTRQEVKINASIEVGYLEATLTSSRVSITAHSRNNRMKNSRYELSVPIGTEVRASSVSGEIVIRGTAGEVSAHAVSGDIEVRDAGDRVEIESVSGDVKASKLRGRIRASSVSGNLTAEDISGDLNGKTVSGDVLLRGTLTGADIESVSGTIDFAGDLSRDGSFSVNTHSGDIRLTLPANIGATLDLQTFSGSVRTGYPITLQPGEQSIGRRNRRQRFDVNGGGARLNLQTFSGDIILDKGAARVTKEN